jgi:hypothetical protein
MKRVTLVAVQVHRRTAGPWRLDGHGSGRSPEWNEDAGDDDTDR